MITQAPISIPVNLRLVLDLEAVLEQLLDQHRKLMQHVSAHHAAMKLLDLPKMDQTNTLQQAGRTRILALEQQRRSLTLQIGRMSKLPGEPRLQQLAELFPTRKPQLLRLREQLRVVVTETARQNYMASKLASAVLGHLNTAVRILARAVGDSGVYNGRGLAKISKRLSRMEITG